MNPDRRQHDLPPTPEQLAAFADGELAAEESGPVERWLLNHPETAREIARQRWVSGLFRDHGPPEPSAAMWDRTLAGIQTRLASPTDALPRSQGWPWRLVTGLVAATLLGGAILAWSLWSRPADLAGPIAKNPPQIPALAELDNEEPFPVVVGSEVNIISVDAEDADRIILDRPMMGEINFVAPSDIQVLKLEAGPEAGPMPHLTVGGAVPMIVVAAVQQPLEEP